MLLLLSPARVQIHYPIKTTKNLKTTKTSCCERYLLGEVTVNRLGLSHHLLSDLLYTYLLCFALQTSTFSQSMKVEPTSSTLLELQHLHQHFSRS
jgi:hypothetical protein